jgi:hypothetical protein
VRVDDRPNVTSASETKQEAPAAPAPGRQGFTRSEVATSVLAVLLILVGGVLMLAGRGTATPAAASIAPAANAPATASSEADALPGSEWNDTNRAFWVGKQKHSAAFELPADNRIAIWMNSVRPSLVVRCTSGKIEAFVYTQSAARIEPQTDDHTITLALDQQPVRTERWADSEDHDALFAPDGVAFARELTRSQTMQFGFTPHNASPVTVRFSVRGLAQQLQSSARECGWTN